MKKPESNNLIPVAWFAVALLQQYALWLVLPGPSLHVAAWQATLGMVVLLGGLAFLVRARRRHALVEVEVHGWTDCPANLAMLVALVGNAVWCGTLLSLLPIAGFISVLSAQFVVSDEMALITRPGAARR